ncbi:MAG: fibronectin type III domain-containing protein [Bryobacteraceae bacterium]
MSFDRRIAWPASLLSALLTSGCGYIAGPVPPLANIPARVHDLAAIQRGAKIIAHFLIPQLTTEGVAIQSPVTFDFRAGEGNAPFDLAVWASHARKFGPPVQQDGLATYEIPCTDWTGKEVILGVRVIGANGKDVGWSNLVVVQVVAPPDKPSNLKAETADGGVRLAWQARGGHFRVLRSSANPPSYETVATVTAPEWLDTHVEFGTLYSYLVQTFEPLGNGKEAQSDLSEAVRITPEAPAPPAPQGLRAVPTPQSIELSWNANPDAEIASYRIDRAEGDGPFAPVGQVEGVPSYSDRAVRRGVAYRYQVVAMGANGKTSQPSQPASATIQ